MLKFHLQLLPVLENVKVSRFTCSRDIDESAFSGVVTELSKTTTTAQECLHVLK